VIKNIVSGIMVPTFNDFIFGKPAGEKGIVKSPYGYHYIEILSQKGSSPAYKIAYLSKPILASDETVNGASTKASQFIVENRTLKEFEDNARKKESEYYHGSRSDASGKYDHRPRRQQTDG